MKSQRRGAGSVKASLEKMRILALVGQDIITFSICSGMQRKLGNSMGRLGKCKGTRYKKNGV